MWVMKFRSFDFLGSIFLGRTPVLAPKTKCGQLLGNRGSENPSASENYDELPRFEVFILFSIVK